MSFRYFLENIKFVSYFYQIMIAYIIVRKWRSVISSSLSCLFLISTKTQAGLFCDQKILLQNRSMPYSSWCWVFTSSLGIENLAVLLSYFELVYVESFHIQTFYREKTWQDVYQFCLIFNKVAKICSTIFWWRDQGLQLIHFPPSVIGTCFLWWVACIE